AGIMRLRPVLITVGATVIALFPLASHGGPLWEPMCYAQIGGFWVAPVLNFLPGPVVYPIFVLRLKLVELANTRAPSDAGQEDRKDDIPKFSSYVPKIEVNNG